MATFPEALGWLTVSATSKSPSTSQVYAIVILDEIERLNRELEAAAAEVENRERLRHEALTQLRELQKTFDGFEAKVSKSRDSWDHDRVALETEVRDLKERLQLAEGTLRDVHYGLTKQPELTREEIAGAITSVVKPYKKGERP